MHDFIFQILKSIPQDGTFNQKLPIEELFKSEHPYVASFDLSAATDRLPIKLQKQILSEFISEEFAEAWAHLLVGRPWTHSTEGDLFYSVGQPMGALSS